MFTLLVIENCTNNTKNQGTFCHKSCTNPVSSFFINPFTFSDGRNRPWTKSFKLSMLGQDMNVSRLSILSLYNWTTESRPVHQNLSPSTHKFWILGGKTREKVTNQGQKYQFFILSMKINSKCNFILQRSFSNVKESITRRPSQLPLHSFSHKNNLVEIGTCFGKIEWVNASEK